MKKTLAALFTFAALTASAAPTVSYQVATNIALAVHAQEMADVARIVSVAPFLYEMDCYAECKDDWKKWYDTFGGAEVGGCLSFRANGIHARNYDWKFDRTAEFVVRTGRSPTRHASIGIANVGTNLTDEAVSKGLPSWFYRVVPGRMMDGINDAGVAINVNVVHAKGNEATLWPGREMSAMGAVRYVLDNCTNAFDAAKWITQKVYIPAKFVAETGYSFHWMVSDERETYIVEDGAMHLIVDPAAGGGEHWYFDPVMSNYRMYLNSSSGAAFARNIVGTYDPYGCGIERSDLVRAGLSSVVGSVSALDLLMEAWYSKAYPSHPAADPFWYTEFTSEAAGLTMLSPDAQLRALADAADILYIADHAEGAATYRTGLSWHTVHSAAYDLANRTLTVRVQEGDVNHNFSLIGGGGGGGGVSPEAVREIVNPMIAVATNGAVASAEENAERMVSKKDAADFANPDPYSLIGRITNDRVKLRVEDGDLSVVDGTNEVWSSAAVARKRDKTDNRCYVSEGGKLGGWDFSEQNVIYPGVEFFVEIYEAPEDKTLFMFYIDADDYGTVGESDQRYSSREAALAETEIYWDYAEGDYERVMDTVTRRKVIPGVCVSNELFVTPSFVTNAVNAIATSPGNYLEVSNAAMTAHADATHYTDAATNALSSALDGKRDLADNRCYASEGGKLGGWDFSEQNVIYPGVEFFVEIYEAPEDKTLFMFYIDADDYGTVGESDQRYSSREAALAETEIYWDYAEGDYERVMDTVTRRKVIPGVCVSNELFVTPSFVTNAILAATNALGKATTSEIGNVKSVVYSWEQFLDGSNVVFSITNYISGTYNLADAKLKVLELKDIGGGEKVYAEVYNSRDEIVLHQTDFDATIVQPGFTSIANTIKATSNWVNRAKAPIGWGTVASDGLPAPTNTVVIRAPSTVFAGGNAFERVNVGTGTVGFLTNKGAATYAGEPGTFRFRDAITGEYFGYVKNTYTLGVHTDGISVDSATHMVTLTYNVTMSAYPIIKYMPSLDNYDPEAWEPLNDLNGDPIPGASHAVAWEDPDPEPGKKVCHINCTEGRGFFCAEIAGIDGNCRFETNMAAELKGGIVARDATDTNVVFAVEAYVEGGQVKWRIRP